jgi:hypothetical protein
MIILKSSCCFCVWICIDSCAKSELFIVLLDVAMIAASATIDDIPIATTMYGLDNEYHGAV